MNDVDKMLKKFQKVQNKISILIKSNDKGYVLKKRILIMVLFVIVLAACTFLGIKGYISKHIFIILVSGNLTWGVMSIATIDRLLEHNIVSAYAGACNFWIEHQKDIRNDMKKAGVVLAGDCITVNSKLDLVRSGLITLIGKQVCNAINVSENKTLFQLPSRFPDDISKEKEFSIDSLINWSNTVALIFVILYATEPLSEMR